MPAAFAQHRLCCCRPCLPRAPNLSVVAPVKPCVSLGFILTRLKTGSAQDDTTMRFPGPTSLHSKESIHDKEKIKVCKLSILKSKQLPNQYPGGYPSVKQARLPLLPSQKHHRTAG